MVLWGHGKKCDLLPLVFVVVGEWKEVRFVASSFCGSVGAWQEVRFVFSSFSRFCGGMARSTVFVVVSGHGEKYELLPLVFVVVSGHGKKDDLLLLVFVVV